MRLLIPSILTVVILVSGTVYANAEEWDDIDLFNAPRLDLQKALEAAMERIDKLKEKNAVLEKEVDKLENKIEKKNEKISDLENTVADLTNDLEEKDKQLEKKENRNSDLEKRINKKNSKINTHEQTISDLETQNKEFETTITSQSNKILEQDSTISDQNTKIADLEKQIETLENNDSNTMIEDLERKIAKKDLTIDKWQFTAGYHASNFLVKNYFESIIENNSEIIKIVGPDLNENQFYLDIENHIKNMDRDDINSFIQKLDSFSMPSPFSFITNAEEAKEAKKYVKLRLTDEPRFSAPGFWYPWTSYFGHQLHNMSFEELDQVIINKKNNHDTTSWKERLDYRCLVFYVNDLKDYHRQPLIGTDLMLDNFGYDETTSTYPSYLRHACSNPDNLKTFYLPDIATGDQAFKLYTLEDLR